MVRVPANPPPIPAAGAHPWTLGCRTCQREAEARVAELQTSILRYLYGLHANESLARRELEDVAKGESAK